MPSLKAHLIIFTCFLLVIGVIVTNAATDCPALVQYALKTIDDACSDTGRNQACYGNITLLAEPQPGMDRLPFHQKGDRVNLVDVKSLKLSAMDASANSWGVALLKVQANLPDTLPGQNVTFLLFGDVSLNNGQTDPKANSANTKNTIFGPMQAFTFRTGLYDAPCEKAPSSGILIQSPTEAKVQLRANAVDVTLGSTVYLQLTSATEMTISVVDGQATLTAFGKTVVAPAGTRVRVAIDATTLAASAAPSDAEPYAAADIPNLPVQHLPIVIGAVAPTAKATTPVTATLPTSNRTPQPTPSSVSSDLPLSGEWDYYAVGAGCPQYAGEVSVNDLPNVQFTFEQDGKVLHVIWVAGPGGTLDYQRVETGVYVWNGKSSLGDAISETLYVHSNSLITRYYVGTQGCVWNATDTYNGPTVSPTSTPAS